ncbi:MAG: MFS transporter, partial [Micromonosporaceae bacterium]|nr:MFS transporter [Micromonosporaceae bacterium]
MSNSSVRGMTTKASNVQAVAGRGIAGVAEAGLPWRALLVLASATLIMVTGEMLPTAVLPQMSAGLGVSQARTGLLVSLWAAVVVVASFPLVGLTRRIGRRTVIAGSLAAFATSSAATALAPTYAVAAAGRTLGAAAVGLLWATVNAYVADLVPDRLLARATAVVLGGATLGTVVGAPAGRFVADVAGWRASFWLLAAAGLVTAWMVRTVVPAGAPPVTGRLRRRARSGNALAPVVAVTLLAALVLVGHVGAYTYVTRLGERPASILPGGMETLLLGFGIASAAGLALASRAGQRLPAALVTSSAGIALTVLGLSLADAHTIAGLVVVLAWGLASGALPPLAQTLILTLAGPEHRATAGALIPVLFNGGIAVGAALASAVVAHHGVRALPLPAAALVATAAVGLAVTN